VGIVAHRAGPSPSPENTLAALERGIAAGADWAEIDVQLTQDHVPVVVHDVDLMRVAGNPRRISRVDYRDVTGLVQRPDDGTPPSERRIATLEDFLERARGRIGLVLELKYYGWDPGLAAEVAGVLRESGTEDGVMVMSLELRAVRQLRRMEMEAPVGYAAAAAVGDATRLPVDFLSLSRRAATPSLMRSARRRGIGVHVWTVNRAPEMAEVIQEGADGLVTDRPGLAVRVREELEGMTAVSRLLLRFGLALAEEEGGPDEPGDP
jgi:glycerophosphoryl diester phosphodiesterase